MGSPFERRKADDSYRVMPAGGSVTRKPNSRRSVARIDRE